MTAGSMVIECKPHAAGDSVSVEPIAQNKAFDDAI